VVESNLAAPAETKIELIASPRLSNSLQGLIGAALVVGLCLRLLGLHYAPYDSHSFRQCQTLSTIEDFYRNGIDFLHPHTLYMGYPGVFVLELPLFQAIGATLYHCFGPHLEVIRLLNIVFGALTTIILYRTSLLWFDRTIAILGASIYWLAPLNVLYQRSSLLDPMAVFCALVSFYSLALLLTEPVNNDGSSSNLNPTQKSLESTHTWIHFWVFAFATFLTSLIKALYLWPAVLLFGQCYLARKFKFDRQLFRILFVFAVAGVCFMGWNRYAARVNAANLLTAGIKPTSHIGYSALLKWDFYSFMLKTRPKEWLGLSGALFYVFGLWAWWSERQVAGWRSRLFLIVCVPPTYLLAFAKINYPHNYYQLIITPFLAIVSAKGVVWLAKKLQPAPLDYPVVKQNLLAIVVSVWTVAAVVNYVVWFKWPQIDSRTVAFERLCAGKVGPWAPTILFSTEHVTGMKDELPSYLYAGKLWGYGWVVPNAESAKEKFEVVRRGFERLDYMVFYGTELPQWVPSNDFQLIHQDDANRFFVFQSKKERPSVVDRDNRTGVKSGLNAENDSRRASQVGFP